jgi:3-methyladenine DNA glycosylase AlkC
VATQLKHFFNEEIVRAIARDLRRADPAFRSERFVRQCMTGLAERELIARGWHIADALHDRLPQPFAAAAEILISSLGPEAPATGELGMAPFRYLPHVLLVQKHGLDDFEAAMRAQYELTKRFTAESSIRAYLVRYPRETLARLEEWIRDDSAHVRRLVSEGTRPRLPWASRLKAFQEDPRPVLALLEKLKDDPVRYVQRSVANNLNDIGKDHPDLAVATCRAWLEDASPGRRWIVSHALRSLVKKGHSGALDLMGAGAKPSVRIDGFRLSPERIKIGGRLRFAFELVSTARKAQELLVDYAVHFVKANGTTRPKVFKLRRLSLSPSARAEFAGAVSFAAMTTRRHYPGTHSIDVLVNGAAHRVANFELQAGP